MYFMTIKSVTVNTLRGMGSVSETADFFAPSWHIQKNLLLRVLQKT
jgi:hypothetical protein